LSVEDRFNRRVKYFSKLIIILFLILLSRTFYLQVVSGNRYKKLANGNRIDIRGIKAPRGKIKTKDGKILVSNRLAYTVTIVPDKAKKNLNVTLKRLNEILKLNLGRVKEKIAKKGNSGAIILKRDISQKELVIIEENRNELPGVIIDKVPVRDYVYGSFASHMLGYVGEISAAKLNKYRDLGYRANDIIGKTGLEFQYEKYLRGENGRRQIEVNNLGQKVRILGIDSPTSGNDLILNIDFRLQKIAEKYLEEELEKLRKEAQKEAEMEIEDGERVFKEPPTGGSVVILNPDNGQVLALVNTPNYDLSLFSGGISIEAWQKLNSNPQRPLFNRAIKSTPPSGSIFKLVTGTAAIKELGITGGSQFYDPGYYKVGGVRFNNWLEQGQGELNFIEAIAHSNNTVFYKLGHRLYKKDKILLQKYAREYGLGQKIGVDLPNEAAGLVPDPEWRKKTFDKSINQIWFPGYTINLSIGQGNLKATPIQLANIVSTIANRGTVYSPQVVNKIIDTNGRLIKNFEPQVLNKLKVDKKTFDILERGMKGVTTYGTAGSTFKDLSISIAGKTGTAQTGANRSNHAWFAGYAPANDPQIAMAVFIEHGSSSSNTLPIAKKIIEEYFISESKLKQKSE
jgi:penicillin-binding protein 2